MANDAATVSDGFSIDKILAVQSPRDLQISPEGDWVAYVVSRNDEDKDKVFIQVWMTSADGKKSVPMTASYANGSDDSDKPKSQVWLLDRRGGEARQYTNIKQGVDGFAWSPDGKRMVLTLTDQDPKDLKDEEARKKGETVKPEPWVIDRLQFKQDYVERLSHDQSLSVVVNALQFGMLSAPDRASESIF